MKDATHNSKYKFDWQPANRFELLIDGPQFFPAMLTDINNARNYILLEMYLVNPGRISTAFFTALAAAAKRGVTTCLLLDDFGSRDISAVQRQSLLDQGVHLAIYNPLLTSKRALMLFRDHRKLLVIDDKLAYVGGTALSDELDNLDAPQHNWRENMVKIQGDNVLQWRQLFNENWENWSNVKLPALTAAASTGMTQRGRVTMTQGPRLLEIKRSFLNNVRRAKHRAWFCTAYFVLSGKLRRSLCDAASRGVDVRVLIPGEVTDNNISHYLAQHYYAQLLGKGVRVYEYQPRFLHAKLVLCDDWVSIGSCNVDRWNLLWNLDANQEVDDPQFSAQIVEMFKQDFLNSKEILHTEWRKRSLFTRFRIAFWAKYVHIADVFFNYLGIIRYWRKLRKLARTPP